MIQPKCFSNFLHAFYYYFSLRDLDKVKFVPIFYTHTYVSVLFSPMRSVLVAE